MLRVDSKPGGMQTPPMPSSSHPPIANVLPAPKYLRPELESLVRALAALPEPERSTVFAAANEQARRERKGPTLSWDDWESARGVVKLGARVRPGQPRETLFCYRRCFREP